jgi:hypothetical protein
MVSYAQDPGVNDNNGGGNDSLGFGLNDMCKDVTRWESVGFVNDKGKEVVKEWDVMKQEEEKTTSSKEKCTIESIHILCIYVSR